MGIDSSSDRKAFDGFVVAGAIHRNEWNGEGPSDHVPVVVELDVDGAEDDDDLPMIF
jgi:exodeoxyribonuclease III